MHPFGLWADHTDDERVIGWTQDLYPSGVGYGAVYLSFIGDEAPTGSGPGSVGELRPAGRAEARLGS